MEVRQSEPSHILPGSTWWRASRYEVIGGTHVAPAQNAEIVKYDPLSLGRRKERPYAQLLRLDLSDPEALRKWADQFGLLGILLHQTVDAFFWPRWEYKELISGFPLSGSTIQQLQYWVGRPFEPVWFEQTGEAGRHPLGTPVEPEDLLALGGRELWGTPERPRIRYIEPLTGTLQEMDLAEGYAQFFPRVDGVCEYTECLRKTKGPSRSWLPDADRAHFKELTERLNRGKYPEPLSGTFLHEYGEPITAMRGYIGALRDTALFWDKACQAASVQEVDSIVRSVWQPDAGLPSTFTAGINAVQPTSVPSDSKGGGVRWKPGWSSRSLYGSLNAMILEDFTLRGAQARTCSRCKQLFTTTRGDKDYCSPQCRKAAQMARYRERGRSKKREVQKNLEEST